MKRVTFAIISIFLLSCVGIYKKEKFTEQIPFNSPRMGATLFIIEQDSRKLNGNLYANSGSKEALLNLTKQIQRDITDCRCFTSFAVVSKFDDLNHFADYKNKVKIVIHSKMNPAFLWNYFITGLTLGLIPTWNRIEYSFEVVINDKQALNGDTYANQMTEYRHLFLVFPFLYRYFEDETQFPILKVYDKTIQKILKDIYDGKMIPIG